MDTFDLKKYLAEGKLLKEENDDVGMINYLKSLPDQYDMSNSQYDLWEDIIESIEGFTSQEIKNYIKDLPNLWDMSDSQYDLWEDIIDNFDLKKYLAEGKLVKENEGENAMNAFLEATEKAPNQDEILEKFEVVMDSIFGKGIMQKDVSHLIDKAQEEI